MAVRNNLFECIYESVPYYFFSDQMSGGASSICSSNFKRASLKSLLEANMSNGGTCTAKCYPTRAARSGDKGDNQRARIYTSRHIPM